MDSYPIIMSEHPLGLLCSSTEHGSLRIEKRCANLDTLVLEVKVDKPGTARTDVPPSLPEADSKTADHSVMLRLAITPDLLPDPKSLDPSVSLSATTLTRIWTPFWRGAVDSAMCKPYTEQQKLSIIP